MNTYYKCKARVEAESAVLSLQIKRNLTSSQAWLLNTIVLILALSIGEANGVPISVTCGGEVVGSITATTSGGSVTGSFTSTVGGPPPTQAAAAAACNEDHFNWYQIVTADNKPPVDAGGTRLTPPYVDVPPGGYGNDPNTAGDDTQWGDQLPWYYDEGDDPAASTAGFVDGFNIDDNTAGATLSYFDAPGGLAETTLSFKTWLVSLNADGSWHSWHSGFSWDWSNSTGTSLASNLQDLLVSPTNAEYEDLIGDFAKRIPEPGSLILLVIGLLAMLSRVIVSNRQASAIPE